MKKKILFAFSIMLTAIILTACGTTNTPKTKPYSIKTGAYGFDKATITNLVTKETVEKLFDDIIDDNTEFLQWGWLFSFGVGIKDNTEFIFTKDNRCLTINEGLAYELIGDNMLKLHFPFWRGYDYKVYDIVMIFGYQKTY